MGSGGDDPAFVHRLENHETKLLNNLRSQRLKDEYCDLVILTKDNKSLSAHACLLSAFSPRIASQVSRANAQATWGRGPNLYTVQVSFSYEVMEAIMNALYTGIFQPQTKVLNEVLAAAQWLKIAELILVIKEHFHGEDSREEKENNIVITGESSCHKNQFPTLVSALKRESDVANLKDVEEDSNESLSVVCDVIPKSRKIARSPPAMSQNVVIKLPKIDQVDHNTLDAIVKLEVDSSCTVNFDNCSGVVTSTEGDEGGQNRNQHLDAESDKKVSKAPTPSKRPTKSSRASRVRKPKPRPLKEKSTKTGTQKKSSKVAMRGKAQEKKKNAAGKSGKSVTKKSLSKQKSSAGEEEEENAVLDSSLIEEVDQNDPVKEELDFLMGNISYLKCKKCNEKFTNLDVYHQHMVDHPDYKCPNCHLIFYNKAFLTRHIRATHAQEEILKCRHCGFQARTQVMLRAHSEKEHQDSKPFCCPREGCNFTSRKYDRIHKHMVVHSDEKQFMCDKCSQSFARQISLILHQRACYNTQEFLCDLCGQAFNHCHSMRKHRQTIHFGEKKYKCRICDTPFSDHRNLSRHMRIHNNSFPYACAICQQKYRHSNSLKAHMATKHADLPSDVYQSLASNSKTLNLGGASYKRILKNDHINAITARVNREKKNSSKKRSALVKRELSSPTQMYQSSFAGEFLIPQDESNFDTNNSDNIELVIETPQDIQDLSCISRPLGLNGPIVSESHVDDVDSSRFQLDSDLLGKSTTCSLYPETSSPRAEPDHASVTVSMAGDNKHPRQSSSLPSVFKLSPTDKGDPYKNRSSTQIVTDLQDPRKSLVPTFSDTPFVLHPPFLGSSNYLLAAPVSHRSMSYADFQLISHAQASTAHKTSNSTTSKSVSPIQSHHQRSSGSSLSQYRLSSSSQSSSDGTWSEMAAGHSDKLSPTQNQLTSHRQSLSVQQTGTSESHGTSKSASSPTLTPGLKKSEHFSSQDAYSWGSHATEPIKGDHSSRSPRSGVGTIVSSPVLSSQDKPLNFMKSSSHATPQHTS